MYMSRPTSVLPPPLPLSLSFRLLSSLLVALEDPLHESLIVNVAVRSLVPVLKKRQQLVLVELCMMALENLNKLVQLAVNSCKECQLEWS
mmetsp:Transcript_23109/g.75210  ORF Transcript_23109/g.75210 Transcript_23109/m.75210 type:complete len:90 (+) Transcript_23109:36-305(+)